MNLEWSHEEMDDMAKFALESRGLKDADIERLQRERVLVQPQGRPEQGWYVPSQAAEACTELGADDRQPRWAYALDPLFARWPRATFAVLCAIILLIFGLAGGME